MSVIFILIPLSIVIATGFLFAFIWAVKSGQYEDTCTPSMRLLLDDAEGDARRNAAVQAEPCRITAATKRNKRFGEMAKHNPGSGHAPFSSNEESQQT